MAFPQKYCCNHRWEDAARGRKIQQVIVHDLLSSQLLRLEVVFSHVGMYWDVGICFAACSYLVKILLLFRIVSHLEATIWAVRIKGLMFQNQDHQNPIVKAHLVQRFRGPCFDPCMSLFVHVSCLFAIFSLWGLTLFLRQRKANQGQWSAITYHGATFLCTGWFGTTTTRWTTSASLAHEAKWLG